MATKRPEPTRKKRKINVELLLGLSAIFLSFAALIVSVFQTKIAREQQHAAVWPYLQAMYASDAIGGSRYYILNKGVGPAIIKGVEWKFSDSTYSGTREFVAAEIGYPRQLGRSEMGAGDVFSVGDGITLIEVTKSDSLREIVYQKINNELFSLKVVYSDVYGNCWELKDGATRQLSNCPE